jgi:uncharacterized integral membrane protein
MRYVTGALAILALVLIVVFSLQNLAAVDVSFLFWSVSAPKVLLVLGSYALGLVSGFGMVELIKWSAR